MPALHQHSTTPHRGTFWACAWYVVTLGAWLASWTVEPLGETDAASLASLAIFTELVSVAVRWKWFSETDAGHWESQDKSAAEIVWLCAWGGQANSLGLVAMLSPNLSSTFPGLIVTAMIEVFLFRKSPFVSKAIAPRGPRPTASEVASPTSPLLPPTIEAAASEPDDQHWTRSTLEGRTEAGQRFLSGWIRFEMAADQKAATLNIGFSPAFPSPPEVELDQEVDSDDSHCEAILEHVTPAGMRVAIKRTAVGSPLEGKLLWHASEAEQASSLLSTRLP